MNTLGTYRAGVAATLAAVAPPGVHVTTNPAAQPPMILVDVVTGDEPVGVGAWRCTLPIRCVSQPPADAAAVALLEAMHDAVIATLGWAPWQWGPFRPTLDVELPAYTFTYTVTIPNPHC